MENKEYAGFWIRCGASLIDMVVLIIITVVPLFFIYGDAFFIEDKNIHGIWDLLFSYILPFVGTIWFWLKYRATPGKMATKLEIVDALTGNKMSTGQAIGRYFAYIISTVPFGLGFIWIGIDKRKQGWHDKLAGTVVIRNLHKESVQFETSANK
ncbi:RDD family protein [Oceanisphaera sp. IT1-181]|uniref:RDD family protein n=1 Tax=Oceanisphaera sp. IT1-181 TaxID=3081199 RepID=UPI0029CA08AC|nr:RDD family protein [Oceanisphaera sp. IT1-181]